MAEPITRAEFVKRLVADMGLPDPAPLKAASSETLQLPHLVKQSVLLMGLEPNDARAYEVDLDNGEIKVAMKAEPQEIEITVVKDSDG